MRIRYLIRAIMLTVFLATVFSSCNCACKCKAEKCPCTRSYPEALLSRFDYMAAVDSLIESGVIEEGSREEKRLRKAAASKKASEFFGDKMRDTGYEVASPTIDPADPSQNCPLTIRWSTCFDVIECTFPGAAETGPYTEILSIRPAAGGIDGDVADATIVYKEIERESIAAGECDTFEVAIAGLYPAGIWDVSVILKEVTNVDCPGETSRDVTANDEMHGQFEVGCYCGRQESYDIAILTEPNLDYARDELRWNVVFPWVACGKHPPESKMIHEKLTIVRDRDGAVVVDRDEDFEMMMGVPLGRFHDLYVGDFVAVDDYTMTVVLTGGDCACREEDLAEDSRWTFSFTLN